MNVLKYEALNCVTNGIPLILLDSRPELVPAEKVPDGPPDDEPEVLLEDKATTPAAPTRYDIHVAAERLRKHSEALNRLILFDTMVGSALACVRASLKHKVKEHRVDKQLWLYDAVIRATLQSHHERGDANPEDLSIEDEDVSMATEILINHVADQLSKAISLVSVQFQRKLRSLYLKPRVITQKDTKLQTANQQTNPEPTKPLISKPSAPKERHAHKGSPSLFNSSPVCLVQG